MSCSPTVTQRRKSRRTGFETKLIGSEIFGVQPQSDHQRKPTGNSEQKRVERDEFCELLVTAKKRLVRHDVPELNLRGLLEEGTGIHYLIEREKLFSSAR